MLPLEFKNWAVFVIGGHPSKAKVGDKGIDGRLFPACTRPEKRGDMFDEIFEWFPIQVKQKDKAGHQDINLFDRAMERESRKRGFFVSFDYT